MTVRALPVPHYYLQFQVTPDALYALRYRNFKCLYIACIEGRATIPFDTSASIEPS